MRVLVTGSSGFIGRHLAMELHRRRHTVIGFDRPTHDVCDRAAVRAMCDTADAVVNLAGMLGTPELFGSEHAAVEVNVAGAVNVYDAARRAGIPVVQIGTGHRGQPNPYAITKACAEDLGLARAQWSGEKITVVRAYHVYGEGQPPGRPYGPAGVHKFFPTFACRALSGLPLELCGGGGQAIDPVHVTSVARTLTDAITDPRPGQVVEAGCGKPFTVAQAAADIAAAAGGITQLVGVAARAGEPVDAEVVAADPACSDPWPYLVGETVEWYRQWLSHWSPS